MNPGALKDKIKILQKSTNETDDNGFPLPDSYIVFANPWAQITPVSGREYYAAATTNAENDVKFRVRYVKGLQNDMFIGDYNDPTNTPKYNIKSIIDINNEHREIDIIGEMITDG